MEIAFFNAKPYDRQYFDAANTRHGHTLHYLETHLTALTADLVTSEEAVCVFINDTLDRDVIARLAARGVKLLALRSAGFNHVDLVAAGEYGLPVVRVPAYSPYAVAEHAASLLMALNRRLPRAWNRVREGDFSLHGLMGFDLHGKTVGVVGTGKIGCAFTRIMQGFGCRILAHDPFPPVLEGVEFVSLPELLAGSDIISLHCPLTQDTHHLIDADALALTRPGVTLINTSRGQLLDTRAVIRALKKGHISLLGLDVYEEEENLFFEDLSENILQDDVFARLLTFPNVLVTGHQAFFTREAVTAIAESTLANITAFARGEPLENQVLP